MNDIPELFDLGDRVLLGPRPAAEVAEVIRVAGQLLTRAQMPPLPRRLVALAEHLERFSDPAVHGSAALPQQDSSIPSEHAPILLDPISTSDAARILGCTENAIRQRLRRHTLPGRRVAGRWWIERADLTTSPKEHES
ncbi:helix-turn-helix domain-containing protein [Rhodococcus artemisiae]|uniref:Helix-turn-helix domain-containing protein n=1 Tax=Rhodococcus artemisiae TaxID=714159 RepID=A0ABU7LBI1_9NOCA|nr:helix-turn-helix domain-containing protein [Rhodococcus artemisiae]MEE2058272.1 helix-turn-helix domain-containing protein [Rhodococcus artemisiae]